jgi:hypothetical protein
VSPVVFIRCKVHGWGVAIAKTMRQPLSLSIFLGTFGQFATKWQQQNSYAGCLRGTQRHFHNCFHAWMRTCICLGVGSRW